MRRAFAVSLLLHAGALAAAWPIVAGARPARPPVAVELQFRVEAPPAPEALPAEPELPRERAPSPDLPAPDPPAPRVETEFVAAPQLVVPDAFPPVNACLRRPLVRPARVAPRPVPPPPSPERAAPSAPRAAAPAPFVPPRLRRGENPAVAYPERARRLGLEGRTVLRVEIDASGRAASVEVVESSGHAILDEAAVAAVRRWRFEPARRGDRPVAHGLRVPIRFTLG